MSPALLIRSVPPRFNAPLTILKSPLLTATILFSMPTLALIPLSGSARSPAVVTLNIGVSFWFLISNALLSLASKMNELL